MVQIKGNSTLHITATTPCAQAPKLEVNTWTKLDSMRRLLDLGVSLGAALALTLAQQTLIGVASVVDDASEIQGMRVRLHGVDGGRYWLSA